MARFSGMVGFIKTQETSPGVYSEVTTKVKYSGDVLRDSRSWENGNYLNDNLRIGNRFSIVADKFAIENYSYMRFIEWMGASWKITNVEIQRPRLILTVGDKYNEP